MKKRMTAALAAASLLFAIGALAEDNAALPGTRADAVAAVNTPAAVAQAQSAAPETQTPDEVSAAPAAAPKEEAAEAVAGQSRSALEIT